MPVELSAVIPTHAGIHEGGLAVTSLQLSGERSSPILAVDDFRVTGRPFGPHPHAGFSAITYVFPDSPASLRNRDSLGGHAVVGPGGLCWLQAGSGAMHEEIPAETGRELHGLQVFVNLGARNKQAQPRTLSVPAEQVPVWRSGAGGDRVRVVVGAFGGLTSPLEPLEPFTLLDVALRREVDLPLAAGRTAVVYVRSGEAVVHAGGRERRVAPGEGLTAAGGAGSLRLETSAGAELVVLSGVELQEPVVVRGPFVMNDAAQIAAAVERFQAGRMGSLAPYTGG